MRLNGESRANPTVGGKEEKGIDLQTRPKAAKNSGRI